MSLDQAPKTGSAPQLQSLLDGVLITAFLAFTIALLPVLLLAPSRLVPMVLILIGVFAAHRAGGWWVRSRAARHPVSRDPLVVGEVVEFWMPADGQDDPSRFGEVVAVEGFWVVVRPGSGAPVPVPRHALRRLRVEGSPLRQA